jgi:hypothetical protein
MRSNRKETPERLQARQTRLGEIVMTAMIKDLNMIIETIEQFDERNSYYPSVFAMYAALFIFILLWSLS